MIAPLLHTPETEAAGVALARRLLKAREVFDSADGLVRVYAACCLDRSRRKLWEHMRVFGRVYCDGWAFEAAGAGAVRMVRVFGAYREDS